jgi:dipeptidase D
MVPQKNNDTAHDFENDPIDAYIDGDWVTAKGTTLGADNGIGAAAAMAILESNEIKHGPVEALFTIDEETGMTGAFGLKAGYLDGDILINMDSEDEGELYVGCAGGIDAEAQFSYEEEKPPKSVKAFKLNVSGLKGGHSGLDIALGRGNSNKILFRYLHHAIGKWGMRLASVDGGSLRNAIPRESFAIVTVPDENADKIEDCVAKFVEVVKNEISAAEPNFEMTATSVDIPDFIIEEEIQNKLVAAIYACPNGVIRMSDTMEGVVETSTNMAIVKSENGKIDVNCLLRSSVDSAKHDLTKMIESVFVLAGAEIGFSGEYPGWKPNKDSDILRTMSNVYETKFGKTPEIKVIHAGLECGILGAVYPHWDMISFGPTIRFPHSPDEKVNIETVKMFWDFLLETLKNIPTK